MLSGSITDQKHPTNDGEDFLEDGLLDDLSEDEVIWNVDDLPRLNLGQRILGGVVSVAETVGPVVMAEALLRDAGIELPAPFNYIAPVLGLLVTREIMNAMNILSRHEHPLEYPAQQGAGSVPVGLRIEASKKLIAAVPPVIAASGLAAANWVLSDYVEAHMETYTDAMIALLYANGALMKTMILTAPTLALYLLTQRKLEENTYRPPMIAPQEHPQLHWYQHLLDTFRRKVAAIAIAEAIGQVFNSMGPERALHDPRLLLLPVAVDLSLQPARYLSDRLYPFKNIDVPCVEPRITLLDDDGKEEAPALAVPGKCRTAVGVTTRVAVAAVLMTGVVALNYFVSPIISEKYADGDDHQNDPAAWSVWERWGFEALLLTAMMLPEKIIENAPAAYRKVKEYCCTSSLGLFGGNQERDIEEGLDNDLAEDVTDHLRASP
jgi:hypothetical protein